MENIHNQFNNCSIENVRISNRLIQFSLCPDDYEHTIENKNYFEYTMYHCYFQKLNYKISELFWHYAWFGSHKIQNGVAIIMVLSFQNKNLVRAERIWLLHESNPLENGSISREQPFDFHFNWTLSSVAFEFCSILKRMKVYFALKTKQIHEKWIKIEKKISSFNASLAM